MIGRLVDFQQGLGKLSSSPPLKFNQPHLQLTIGIYSPGVKTAKASLQLPSSIWYRS